MNLIDPKKAVRVLGVMSGTSLDGLDLALCTFSQGPSGAIVWALEASTTLPYRADTQTWLDTLPGLGGRDLFQAEVAYSQLMGQMISGQLGIWGDSHGAPDLISIHGQTLFHTPAEGLTTQLLDGGLLAVQTGYPVCCDFRRQDVALGGQGAPLVPIADRDLFGAYTRLVNLGGFANLTWLDHPSGEVIAYDVCPANYVLNRLAARLGLPFDEGGCIARVGVIDQALTNELDQLPRYQNGEPPPGSLGAEFVTEVIDPILSHYLDTLPVESVIATYTAHLAGQLSRHLTNTAGEVLLSGGGAANGYLVELLRQRLQHVAITVADPVTRDAKEAIAFAYLGWLRLQGRANTLPTVTGANRAVSAGALYLA